MGLLDSLKGVIFNDDYLSKQSQIDASENTNTSKNILPANTGSANNPTVSTMPTKNTQSDKDIESKLMKMLESINEPGADFFEVWTAAEEMGGSNSQNLKNAFVALRISDKSLDKNKILTTGQNYITKLTEAMNSDANKKADEKRSLEQSKIAESGALKNDVSNLELQIEELKKQLETKRTELNNINSKYNPKIEEIDIKISQGNAALAAVLQKMQAVLQLVQTSIN